MNDILYVLKRYCAYPMTIIFYLCNIRNTYSIERLIDKDKSLRHKINVYGEANDAPNLHLQSTYKAHTKHIHYDYTEISAIQLTSAVQLTKGRF